MSRQTVIVILSIVVSVFSLGVVLRDVPLAEVSESIRGAHYWAVGLACFMVAPAIWTRAVRWRSLLNDRVSVRDGFYMLSVTMMLNQLPLRAGEVARSLIVTQRDVPFMTAATSIVIERILDVLMVVLMIVFAITQAPNIPPEMTRGAVLFGVAGVIGFAVLLFFAHYPVMLHRILDGLFRILPILKKLPLAEWLQHVIEGLHPLTNWRTFAHAIVWTIISWVMSVTALYFAVIALDITTTPWLAALLGTALASLSIAIPVSVAALGLFEGAIFLMGEALGIDPVVATALGFLFHGITVVSYVVLGVPGMLALGVSLGEVFETKKG